MALRSWWLSNLSPRRKRAFNNLAKGLVALIGFASAAGLAARGHFVLEMFTHFKAQYMVGSLGLGALFAYQRKWPWLAASAAMFAVHVVGVASWHLGRPTDGESAEAAKVRLLVTNVLTENKNHRRLVEVVKDADPDVIVMLEISNEWVEGLRELEARYPHRATEPRPDHWGIGIYSKIKLSGIESRRIGSFDAPSILTRFQINGTTVSLMATHPAPPKNPHCQQLRNEQLEATPAALIDYSGDLEGPWIIAGDLNVTMWSPHYRDLIKATSLKNARRGFGVEATWPPFGGPFAIPLDHVLVSDEIRVLDCRTGPRIGSDHLPLIVDLEIPSGGGSGAAIPGD